MSHSEFVELRLRLGCPTIGDIGESPTLRLFEADDEASSSGDLLALSATKAEAVAASPSSATLSSCK
jgi:hypothetical protein